LIQTHFKGHNRSEAPHQLVGALALKIACLDRSTPEIPK